METAPTAEPELHLDRLKHFARRFGPGAMEGPDREALLGPRFEGLWSELGRVATMPDAEMPYEVSSNHARVLARAGSYAWSRFLDALVRWYSILWLHEELGTRARDSSERWKSFAALCIKDAHTDIGSLMDDLALFLVNLDEAQFPRLQEWAPGFGTLLRTDSEPRTKLSPPIQSLADEATDWYGFVRRVRNSLVHRQHVRLIFGAPSKALAFQIYLKDADPAITAVRRAASVVMASLVAPGLRLRGGGALLEGEELALGVHVGRLRVVPEVAGFYPAGNRGDGKSPGQVSPLRPGLRPGLRPSRTSGERFERPKRCSCSIQPCGLRPHGVYPSSWRAPRPPASLHEPHLPPQTGWNTLALSSASSTPTAGL